MRIVSLAAVVLPFVSGLQPCQADDSTGLRVEPSPEQVKVFDAGKHVLTYQRAPKSQDGQHERAGYVHPLFDLDGNVLTEDFPADHRHHRGIFWAWHQLYVGDVRVGDPWICKDFLTEVLDVTVLTDCSGTVAFRATSDWTSPNWVDESGQRKPIVRELATIRVQPAVNDTRSIDFEIRLTAAEAGVRLGGSDDRKGYGGFSPRIRLPDGLRFLAQWGVAQPQTTSVDASPWMDMTGRFGDDDQQSGVTILSHPSVPDFPQRWILRQKRSMQNPVYPGREAVELSTEKPLVFRYRLVLHRGEVAPERINEWQEAFSEQ